MSNCTELILQIWDFRNQLEHELIACQNIHCSQEYYHNEMENKTIQVLINPRDSTMKLILELK